MKSIIPSADNPQPLRICALLFDKLAQDDVLYCHWKSNGNLHESLSGQTDLDLLISEECRENFNAILAGLCFKRLLSPPEKQFPGMEDYLGFDKETGKLCHLHVHYNLILGHKYVKDLHLPIEDFVLANRRNIYGVYVPSAEVELLLLVIRANLKSDLLGLLSGITRKDSFLFPKSIFKEFELLLRDYKKDIFERIVSESDLSLSPSVLSRFIEKISNKNLLFQDLLSMRSYLIKSLGSYRRNSLSIYGYKYLPFFLSSWFYAKKTILGTKKKSRPGNGRIFALVGADGSGKTTLSKDITRWLSWKVETDRVYFGAPKNIVYKLFSRFVSLMRIFKGKGIYCLSNKLSALKWIWVSKKRQKLYIDCLKKQDDGEIVIADRFPLQEFHSMSRPMDGPRIRKENRGRDSSLAVLEEMHYSQIKLPSLVCVIKTDIQQLRRRRASRPDSFHKEKAEAVDSIVNRDGLSVIDGNRPYQEVLLDMKTKIWEIL